MQLSFILAIMTSVILICLLSSKLSYWLNVPTLLLFLGIGMLFGSLNIHDLTLKYPFLIKYIGDLPLVISPTTANYIGATAMAFILFSGGFDTSWKDVRKVFVTGGILSSIGVLLTAIFVGVFAWLVLPILAPDKNISLSWCLLLGSVISSTDAAAVFAILRSKRVSLKGNMQPLLEFESGSNDPMAAFLTVFMINVVLAESSSGVPVSLFSYWTIVPMFFLKMSLGIIFGLIFGKAAIFLYNKIDFEYDGLYYVLAFVTVMLTFSASELLWGNGFMAVYVAGMVLGNQRFVFHNGIGKFYDGFAWLMQVVLFSMLGWFSMPKQIWEAKWAGLAVAAFLMLVARPAAVFLGMIKSRFTYSERTLASWVGLRGGAPIMLATFPLLAQVQEGSFLFHIVFFIVLSSVFLQGTTLMPLARLLQLDLPLKISPRVPLSFEHTGTMDATSSEFYVDERANQKTLAELNLPKGALVMLVKRDGNFLIPQGHTLLLEGDQLMIMGSDKALEEAGLLLQEKEE